MPGKHFSEVVEAALYRRAFLKLGSAGACAALLAPWENVELKAQPVHRQPLFQFRGVPAAKIDDVVVPEGYVAEVLYRWGDPINGSAPQFKPDASNSADEQARQAGMGHDGMDFFAIPGHDPNQRGMLAVNHEYTDQVLLFRDGLDDVVATDAMPLEKARKSQFAHGVSLVEIARQDNGNWSVVDSPRARRITVQTPMVLAGPATSRLGGRVLGTCNNCAAGRTPWGTYLTCEENFHGVFGSRSADFEPTAHQKRYGLSKTGYRYRFGEQYVPIYRWWEHDSRFDVAQADNDADRYGYVVEIDPMRPDSKPVKRTALGRFKHENAELTLAADGRVVVYMGDDEANEYIYKFVSLRTYHPAQTADLGVDAQHGLLDEGTLYVARFDEDGTGRWLALTPGLNQIPEKSSPADDVGFDLADICIRTREAADLAGATSMDRPEWIAVHPVTKEVFASLTNNKGRKTADAANPRTNNIFGHIIRWRETQGDPGAETFEWRVFVLGGNPAHADVERRGNINGDAFACPDGLRFDPSGILWIQTDMSSSVMGNADFAELGNNMMLAADPHQGEIRRFLTGPVGCEITGMAMTPDRRTMFINIQHPGEPPDEVSDIERPDRVSNWPDRIPGSRPRSATIAIRKLDGGVIGS